MKTPNRARLPLMGSLAVLLAMLANALPSQTTQQAKLVSSEPAADDRLGYSVSISGDTAVVGVPLDDHAGGNDAGSTYVFVRSGTAWTQQVKLEASDPAPGDQFGRSVAISGDTAIVGALQVDHASLVDAGAAYVFVRTGAFWSEEAKLVASDAAGGDRFGESVAIDGDTAIVGGLFNEAAYVFVRTGGTWVAQAKLVASDAGAPNRRFGRSVAISGDAAIVGAFLAYNDPVGTSGAAYVFARSAGTWAQQARVIASDLNSDDDFGWSVSISGDTALVGARNDQPAGSAYVFERTGGTWLQQAKLIASDAFETDGFGWSVAVSGERAIIGAVLADSASGAADAGAAYVFVRNGGAWPQWKKLVASDPGFTDQLGWSVAISGQTAIAGAHQDENDPPLLRAGSAYVFAPTLAGYTTFGTACPGTGGLPALGNAGVPMIGVPFSVDLTNARGLAPATLLVGRSKTQWGLLPLPFDLGVIGATGCNLYASGEIQLGATTSAAGAASLAITFANKTALIGLQFYNQYVILDPANPLGLVFTNRGDGTIGG